MGLLTKLLVPGRDYKHDHYASQLNQAYSDKQCSTDQRTHGGNYSHDISAARYVAEQLTAALQANPMFREQDVQKKLVSVGQACRQVQQRMHTAASCGFDASVSGAAMGCVYVSLRDGLLHVANLGDVRAVLGRLSARGPGVEAIQLTVDATPDHPQEHVRLEWNGAVLQPVHPPENDGAAGPRTASGGAGGNSGGLRVMISSSPTGGLHVSRSLGDIVAHSHGVLAEPDCSVVKLHKQDRFLVLASASVWRVMGNGEVVHFVHRYSRARDSGLSCADALTLEVQERSKAVGGPVEDVAVCVIFFSALPPPATHGAIRAPKAFQSNSQATTQPSEWQAEDGRLAQAPARSYFSYLLKADETDWWSAHTDHMQRAQQSSQLPHSPPGTTVTIPDTPNPSNEAARSPLDSGGHGSANGTDLGGSADGAGTHEAWATLADHGSVGGSSTASASTSTVIAETGIVMHKVKPQGPHISSPSRAMPRAQSVPMRSHWLANAAATSASLGAGTLSSTISSPVAARYLWDGSGGSTSSGAAMSMSLQRWATACGSDDNLAAMNGGGGGGITSPRTVIGHYYNHQRQHHRTLQLSATASATAASAEHQVAASAPVRSAPFGIPQPPASLMPGRLNGLSPFVSWQQPDPRVSSVSAARRSDDGGLGSSYAAGRRGNSMRGGHAGTRARSATGGMKRPQSMPQLHRRPSYTGPVLRSSPSVLLPLSDDASICLAASAPPRVPSAPRQFPPLPPLRLPSGNRNSGSFATPGSSGHQSHQAAEDTFADVASHGGSEGQVRNGRLRGSGSSMGSLFSLGRQGSLLSSVSSLDYTQLTSPREQLGHRQHPSHANGTAGGGFMRDSIASSGSLVERLCSPTGTFLKVHLSSASASGSDEFNTPCGSAEQALPSPMLTTSPFAAAATARAGGSSRGSADAHNSLQAFASDWLPGSSGGSMLQLAASAAEDGSSSAGGASAAAARESGSLFRVSGSSRGGGGSFRRILRQFSWSFSGQTAPVVVPGSSAPAGGSSYLAGPVTFERDRKVKGGTLAGRQLSLSHSLGCDPGSLAEAVSHLQAWESNGAAGGGAAAEAAAEAEDRAAALEHKVKGGCLAQLQLRASMELLEGEHRDECCHGAPPVCWSPPRSTELLTHLEHPHDATASGELEHKVKGGCLAQLQLRASQELDARELGGVGEPVSVPAAPPPLRQQPQQRAASYQDTSGLTYRSAPGASSSSMLQHLSMSASSPPARGSLLADAIFDDEEEGSDGDDSSDDDNDNIPLTAAGRFGHRGAAADGSRRSSFEFDNARACRFADVASSASPSTGMFVSEAIGRGSAAGGSGGSSDLGGTAARIIMTRSNSGSSCGSLGHAGSSLEGSRHSRPRHPSSQLYDVEEDDVDSDDDALPAGGSSSRYSVWSHLPLPVLPVDKGGAAINYLEDGGAMRSDVSSTSDISFVAWQCDLRMQRGSGLTGQLQVCEPRIGCSSPDIRAVTPAPAAALVSELGE